MQSTSFLLPSQFGLTLWTINWSGMGGLYERIGLLLPWKLVDEDYSSG